jgi:hypothetical protein
VAIRYRTQIQAARDVWGIFLMQVQFATVDVFTANHCSGNPLAVVLNRRLILPVGTVQERLCPPYSPGNLYWQLTIHGMPN